MPRLMTPLIERTEVAEGTMAFALERPTGFEFKAGQFVIMVLPSPRIPTRRATAGYSPLPPRHRTPGVS